MSRHARTRQRRRQRSDRRGTAPAAASARWRRAAGGRARPRPQAARARCCSSASACWPRVSTVFGMMMAVASDLPKLEAPDAPQLGRSSTHDGHQIGDADRQRAADLPHRGPDRAGDEARDHRDRGPPLLHQRGRRPARHRARRRPGRHVQKQARPGRLDDPAAVRQDRARRPERPHGLPEAARGRARLPPHAQVVQGADPAQLPEHDLLRQRRLRDRVGRAHLLPPNHRAATSAGDKPLRVRPAAGRGGAAGRDGRVARARTTRSRIPRRRRAGATSCSCGCSSRAT